MPPSLKPRRHDFGLSSVLIKDTYAACLAEEEGAGKVLASGKQGSVGTLATLGPFGQGFAKRVQKPDASSSGETIPGS